MIIKCIDLFQFISETMYNYRLRGVLQQVYKLLVDKKIKLHAIIVGLYIICATHYYLLVYYICRILCYYTNIILYVDVNIHGCGMYLPIYYQLPGTF